MTAQLLKGRDSAKQLQSELSKGFSELAADTGVQPTLAALQVGTDAAAAGYLRAIRRACQGVGTSLRPVELSEDSSQGEVQAALTELNEDGAVHGIMVLEPLPDHIDSTQLIDLLSPAKDVDGVHPLNAGRLAAQREPHFVPATPAGAMRMLEEAEVDFKGKRAVVIGRSDIVGKPMALLLLHRHCTVTIAHSRTENLPAVARMADILCVAVGRPEMVTGDWVKPGAVVVDFGTTYVDGALKGDCEQDSVAEVAGKFTPVPGGTGPMTNVMLMRNLLSAYRRLAAAPGI
ncbi:MAG: bifunctional 5,10-methylenetetrahydrofolate dehydrogenase/5,10-methenyltetrahydrofolate cyclohydrolase [Caldilineaceae bacterium]|nr:bifunctional 5,10-methylenetetrahydrofolate dehydrogenase/5,10-methenyltetrahydrofolate cyclohydrolase [Caldilineaceae bacterium]